MVMWDGASVPSDEQMAELNREVAAGSRWVEQEAARRSARASRAIAALQAARGPAPEFPDEAKAMIGDVSLQHQSMWEQAWVTMWGLCPVTPIGAHLGRYLISCKEHGHPMSPTRWANFVFQEESRQQQDFLASFTTD